MKCQSQHVVQFILLELLERSQVTFHKDSVHYYSCAHQREQAVSMCCPICEKHVEGRRPTYFLKSHRIDSHGATVPCGLECAKIRPWFTIHEASVKNKWHPCVSAKAVWCEPSLSSTYTAEFQCSIYIATHSTEKYGMQYFSCTYHCNAVVWTAP